MAKLRGGVQGNRGPATRLSHDRMTVWANTWEAMMMVDLFVDGTYHIDIQPYGYNRGGKRSKFISGNAHEDIKPEKPKPVRKPRVRRPKPEPVCVLE